MDSAETVSRGKYQELSPKELRRSPYQVRRVGNYDIKEFSAGIETLGFIIEPLVVRINAIGNYELIAGHRRRDAALILKWARVPCVVMEVSDKEAALIGIAENMERKSYTDAEFLDSIDMLRTQFEMTQGEIAKSLMISRSAVANHLRVLKEWLLREAINNGKLTYLQGRELLSHPREIQESALAWIAERDPSKNELLDWLRKESMRLHKSGKAGNSEKIAVDANIEKLEQTLSERLGSPIKIEYSRRSKKGKLTINYFGLDDLDHWVERLNATRRR